MIYLFLKATEATNPLIYPKEVKITKSITVLFNN